MFYNHALPSWAVSCNYWKAICVLFKFEEPINIVYSMFYTVDREEDKEDNRREQEGRTETVAQQNG